MTCKKIQDLIPLYLSRDLNPEEKEELRYHLENCPRCKERFEEYRKIHTLLQEEAASVPEPPEGYYNQLILNLRERLSSLGERKLRLIPIAVSTVFLILLIVYLSFNLQNQPDNLIVHPYSLFNPDISAFQDTPADSTLDTQEYQKMQQNLLLYIIEHEPFSRPEDLVDVLDEKEYNQLLTALTRLEE